MQFCQEVSNIHSDIKLTYELEENSKTPFLDPLNEKTINHLFLLYIASKQNIGLNTNWKNFIPHKICNS